MKIKDTMHVHASRNIMNNDYSYSILACEDMTEYGYIYVRPIEVECEISDDFNPVPAEIAMLRKEKQRIQAEANVKANRIEEKISKLLAIEYKPEVEAQS